MPKHMTTADRKVEAWVAEPDTRTDAERDADIKAGLSERAQRALWFCSHW
jgi:hypothetical protein